MTKQPRESYESILNYVATRCGFSYRRTSLILTEFSKIAQAIIEEGNNLQIDGICTFIYVNREGYIYKNPLLTLEDVIHRMKQSIGLTENDIRRVVVIYCKRIQDLISNGQRVNIKGLCYIQPKEDDKYVYCDTRISAVIKKPNNKSFYVMTDTGHLVVEQLKQEQLRLTIELSEHLTLPTKVLNPEPFTIDTVDI